MLSYRHPTYGIDLSRQKELSSMKEMSNTGSLFHNQSGKIRQEFAIPYLHAHGSLNLLSCPLEFSVKLKKPYLRQLEHRWLIIYVKCHPKKW